MTALKKPQRPRSIHHLVALALQTVVLSGVFVSIYERQWLNAATVLGILVLTALPRFFSQRFEVYIPPAFELATIAFVFAALFLGETRGYYGRFWWWDIALHTTSGGLLGIFGVLLVYVLNEDPRVELHLRPGFVAFFAFCFAVTIGAVWELFEFFMDQTFGMNMQKAMLGDDSGLTDTMWDLIVDSLGALTVALFSYVYMKRRKHSPLERWIERLVEENPRLFKKNE